jgi:hypothetical protein
VGKPVTLEVWRKKQKVTVTATVAEIPEDRSRSDRPSTGG